MYYNYDIDENLIKLATILNVSIDYLVGLSNKKN